MLTILFFIRPKEKLVVLLFKPMYPYVNIILILFILFELKVYTVIDKKPFGPDIFICLFHIKP